MGAFSAGAVYTKGEETMKKVSQKQVDAARQALRCLDVASFEALEACSFEEGEWYYEDMLPDSRSDYTVSLWPYRVGVFLLDMGVSMRHVLIWLYTLHGFKLHYIAKRFGVSGERVRQIRNIVEKTYVKAIRGEE